MNNPDNKYISSLYGGFWNFDIMDFCYMTNQYFPPENFIDSMGENLTTLVKSYPSTNWYLSSLAAKSLSLSHEDLVVANGASELISVIIDKYVEKLAVPIPTFAEFINRSATQGKSVGTYELSGDFHLPIDDFISYVKDTKANAVLIINPNNPTGTLIPEQSMMTLLTELGHLDLVLIDESFIDFSSQYPIPSMINNLTKFPNVILLKSLSKSYGIPGLRLGYAISSNRDRIKEIRNNLPIWSLNSLAQYFLEKIGDYTREFTESCEKVVASTDFLYTRLQNIPYLQPYPTNGNFILVRAEHMYSAQELTSALFQNFNILVKDLSNTTGLDHRFFRIASRTKEQNGVLIEALESLYNHPAGLGNNGSTK